MLERLEKVVRPVMYFGSCREGQFLGTVDDQLG